MEKVKIEEIQPLEGRELEPMCRNCRHWARTMNGICKQKSNIFNKKISPVYTMPNVSCDKFQAWHYHIEKAQDKRDSKIFAGLFILTFLGMVLIPLFSRW